MIIDNKLFLEMMEARHNWLYNSRVHKLYGNEHWDKYNELYTTLRLQIGNNGNNELDKLMRAYLKLSS